MSAPVLSDPRGLAVTAAGVDSVAALEAAIMAYGAFRIDTADRLKAALTADPNLVMGHILHGYLLLLQVKRELLPTALHAAEAADVAMQVAGATPRERLHRRALGFWIARDLEATSATFEAILAADPCDLIALKLGQYVLFYLGAWERMHDLVARAMPAWDDTMPGYGFALGCHAFGLEENGVYDEAERAGRRAVALIPDDIWGAHAVAHVFEMQDRAAEGLGWIEARAPAWRDTGNFRFHGYWHRCLFLLAAGRADEVLDHYDREVRPEPNDEYLDATNAVSLLWRLEQHGVDVGPRWRELAVRAAARIDDHMIAFGNVHDAMALAAAGQPDDVARWIRSGEAYAALGTETQCAVMRVVGLALGEAAQAHRQGKFARAVELLLPLRHEIRRIGGSHAQRDVFAQLLIDAALKARQFDTARMLVSERLAMRPRNSWALGLSPID